MEYFAPIIAIVGIIAIVSKTSKANNAKKHSSQHKAVDDDLFGFNKSTKPNTSRVESPEERKRRLIEKYGSPSEKAAYYDKIKETQSNKNIERKRSDVNIKPITMGQKSTLEEHRVLKEVAKPTIQNKEVEMSSSNQKTTTPTNTTQSHTHPSQMGNVKVEKVYDTASSTSNYISEGCNEHYNQRYVAIDEEKNDEYIEMTDLERIMIYGDVISKPRYLDY